MRSPQRAPLAGEALGAPKSKNGNVEGVRALGVARTSANKSRTQSLNQIRSLASTAPSELREQLRDLTITVIVRTCAAFRPGNDTDVATISKLTLRALSRRVQYLDEEVEMLDARRTELVKQVAPELFAAHGLGPHTAATLLPVNSTTTAAPSAYLVKKAGVHSTDFWEWVRAADEAYDRGSRDWVTDPFASG